MTKRSRMISPCIKPFINKLLTSRKRDELAAVNGDNKMLSGVERNSDGPPEGLGGIVAEYIRSMTEVRVATEFRDYVAWAHQELQTDDIQSVLWTHPPPPTPNLDWQVFEEQLAHDEEKLRIHRLITRGSQLPDNYEKPHVPWFSEFATAVEILGTDDEDIRNQIKAYAQGKPMCHEGIYQLVYEHDLDGLAQRLARETANLEWFFRDRDDPQEEISMRYILERIQSQFFTRCFLQEDKVVYSLTEESERQQMAHFGGQSAGYEDYSNY